MTLELTWVSSPGVRYGFPPFSTIEGSRLSVGPSLSYGSMENGSGVRLSSLTACDFEREVLRDFFAPEFLRDLVLLSYVWRVLNPKLRRSG